MLLQMKIVLIISSFLMVSCSLPLQRKDMDSWLEKKAGQKPGKINVAGKWSSSDGWGNMVLKQEVDKVTGTMSGEYEVLGQASEDLVYLVIYYKKRVFYTLKLQLKNENLLSGNYYHSNDPEQEVGSPTTFVNIK